MHTIGSRMKSTLWFLPRFSLDWMPRKRKIEQRVAQSESSSVISELNMGKSDIKGWYDGFLVYGTKHYA